MSRVKCTPVSRAPLTYPPVSGRIITRVECQNLPFNPAKILNFVTEDRHLQKKFHRSDGLTKQALPDLMQEAPAGATKCILQVSNKCLYLHILRYYFNYTIIINYNSVML